jgi:NAD(P)-dependent dehydrogenase (short-subunit alcohol dehydrogenase family)
MSFAARRRYTVMTSLLTDKIVIIYGAAGGVGRGMARRFAREGATVHLVGRTRAPLDELAEAIVADGAARVATLDALDEDAVTAHVHSVVAQDGRVDVSFNLVRRGDVQGIPFLELSTEDLMAPVVAGTRTAFITARAAARHMVTQGSGVILTLTSASSAGLAPHMGGTGPADATVETLMRYLAAEVGPRGVRVVGLWAAGIPESFPKTAAAGHLDGAAIEAMMSGMSLLRQATHLDELAATAAFLASDQAKAITATIVNVSCGLVVR